MNENENNPLGLPENRIEEMENAAEFVEQMLQVASPTDIIPIGVALLGSATCALEQFAGRWGHMAAADALMKSFTMLSPKVQQMIATAAVMSVALSAPDDGEEEYKHPAEFARMLADMFDQYTPEQVEETREKWQNVKEEAEELVSLEEAFNAPAVGEEPDSEIKPEES